ncbi:putative membrane protein DUF2306 [Scopulibacillus darangshiensis]|uniref:Putative membrane protein DUF2306 n=1 Tax=Scopulibacillus darangshiensis TaxID=442528 RepID=A0A4R2P492_9BACL|nr:DUF2306 domain-containing protein [Scopulibacillus darangshiensis]TCP29620.1 putative membrane protein DUF2306 [Scopulibacillus darangshiensis]
MKKNPKKSWWILVIVSVGVMVPFMIPYFTLDSDKSRVPLAPATHEYPILVSHIVFAFIALITGLLQFVERIRITNPKIHRIIGKIYVSSVFISGLLALAVIFYVENFTKSMAFLTLAILWLFTCWKGYRKAVKRHFNEHRVWMLRSVGLTLVAVSARLLVPVLLLLYYILNDFSLPGGRDQVFEVILNVNIWVGLVLNFIIVEWVILKKSKGKNKKP